MSDLIKNGLETSKLHLGGPLGGELPLGAGLAVLAAAVASAADVVEESIEVSDVDDEGVGVVVGVVHGAHDDFVDHVRVGRRQGRTAGPCSKT